MSGGTFVVTLKMAVRLPTRVELSAQFILSIRSETELWMSGLCLEITVPIFCFTKGEMEVRDLLKATELICEENKF